MQSNLEYLIVVAIITVSSLLPLLYLSWSANRKLAIIHTLVNSALTTVMQGRLDANKKTIVLMKHIVEINRVINIQPSASVLAEIEAAEREIAGQAQDIAARTKGE